MSSLISIKDLNVCFNTERGVSHVVKNLNFSIEKGETFGLVGESGCGKSITSRSLMKLIPPPGKITKGEIIFSQDDNSKNLLNIVDTSPKEMQQIRGKKIGMIFQEPDTALNPIMRVGDQIAETLFIQNELSNDQTFYSKINHSIKKIFSNKKKETKVAFFNKSVQLLKSLDIPDPENIAYRYPHQLSGGMKQRILIAIALAGSPSLLISDEATSSLDVTVQSQIINLLNQLKTQKIIQSILFITHDLGLASICCDRLAVMYAGCMCEIAKIPDIFEHPRHPYTNALLKTIPRQSKDTILNPISGQVPDLVDPPGGCRFHPRCKKAIEKCKTHLPELSSLNSNHKVACWNMHN